MAYTQKLAWETLRSIDSATFTGSYQALGTPLAHPSYICKLVNNSTVLVTISIDGVNDHDVAPASSFWLYDEGKTGLSSAEPALPKGTQVMVKGSAGTGSVYLVTQYIIQS
jgi:hypothetical protein